VKANKVLETCMKRNLAQSLATLSKEQKNTKWQRKIKNKCEQRMEIKRE